MRRAWIAWSVACALAAPAPGAGSEAESAERCWRERASGSIAAVEIDRRAVECAIDGWRAAHAETPESLSLAMQRIEALWYAAHFAARSTDEQRAWLDEAIEVADAAVAEVDRRAGWSGARKEREARATALERVREAGAVHFFAAIAWGEWGLVNGWLASAGRGVPGRIREHSELAAELAPEVRDGGGLRLLGRVHRTMPRVPLVTGWVDRARGRELLVEALARSRRDPRNLLFLAEALLEDDAAGNRAESLALLREVASREPEASELAEQSETIRTARETLARLER